jgi:hypothetical protein
MWATIHYEATEAGSNTTAANKPSKKAICTEENCRAKPQSKQARRSCTSQEIPCIPIESISHSYSMLNLQANRCAAYSGRKCVLFFSSIFFFLASHSITRILSSLCGCWKVDPRCDTAESLSTSAYKLECVSPSIRMIRLPFVAHCTFE